MQTKIIGTVLPVLEIELASGEAVVGVPEQLSWITGGVTLHTSVAAAGGGGLFGLVSRAVSGAGIVMTEMRAENGPGMVGFAAHLPGEIIEIDVGHGAYMVHRHGFLCGTSGIVVSSALQQNLGAGVFGGDGFVLQKIAGEGKAFVELGGEIVKYDLQAGQSIHVHPGHVGLFDEQVSFEITAMRGVRSTFFATGDFFMAKLTGPGRVWLQTLTAPGLAHTISHYLPKQG
ncbi:TIGR00266 family protein [Kaistia algarum]|uniref:AIM24 family protein n=1 Tax=Kaistia algarum TaxID=2083279 RepID=UPI000CE84B06|nr:AIM24 family protein [Kaistia algarum]MCX5516005.1 AIM24 family protein [Kaistia algarum]PPE80641.1 TIGR00266 family protein [Kaistia algarum]